MFLRSTPPLAAAEDGAEHSADHLSSELRADGARRAPRHRLDEALRLLAAARPGPAEQNVRNRIRRGFVFGGCRFFLGSPFELFIRRFAIDRGLILRKK